MESRDCRNKIKLSNNDLKLSPQQEEVIYPDQAETYADQADGIVRIVRDHSQPDQEFRTIQEHHNANHVLYYFSMITEGIIQGVAAGNDYEKIRRIQEHLMNLREFLGEDKADLMTVVNSLLERLEKFCPVDRKQFARFIYKNWSLILLLAKAYGHQERCFPAVKCKMLRDIVLRTCFLKSWWWELRLKKFVKSLRHCIKSLPSRLPLRGDKLAALFSAFLNNKMMAVMNILTTPKIKRERSVIERATCSLEDIFHHFCPQDARLTGLFEELIALLKKCPDLSEEDSKRGLGITEELLKAFDGTAHVDKRRQKRGANNE